MEAGAKRKLSINVTNGHLKGAFQYSHWRNALRDIVFVISTCVSVYYWITTNSSHADLLKQVEECKTEQKVSKQQLEYLMKLLPTLGSTTGAGTR
jgi:hypothetical protein